MRELKIHTDVNKVDSEEYEEIGKLEENDLQTLLKDKLIKDGVSADWLDKHLIIMVIFGLYHKQDKCG